MSAEPPPKSLVERALRSAKAEVAGLLSRQVLADVASHLPSRAFDRTRTALFRAAGVTIGAQSHIQGAMRITGLGNPCELLTIGQNVMITGGLHVDLGAPVRIGDDVRIGHDVSLLTINHAIGNPWFRAGVSYCRGILIDNGCWIASRCIVLPGVVIGKGAIVAAGTVVTRDVAPNTLVAGVPARVIRELGDHQRTADTSDPAEPSVH